MKIKVIEGYLTTTNIKHIKEVFKASLTSAKVNRINYFITELDGVYTVKMYQNKTNDFGKEFVYQSGAKFILA